MISPDFQKYTNTTITPGMKSNNYILPYDLCHLADLEVHQILGLPVKSQTCYHYSLIMDKDSNFNVEFTSYQEMLF